ncbi:MAG TPA: GNAT family N-acetyltransferase [Alphaproteobacteria bacterium]
MLRPLNKEFMHAMRAIRPERKDVESFAETSFHYFKRHTAERNGIVLLALNEKSEAIGFLSGWVSDSDGLDEGHPQTGNIISAYIKPAYRNHYTFKTMGQKAAEHFKELGLDRLFFSTLATNTRTQELFLKLGFKPHKVSFEIKLDELS